MIHPIPKMFAGAKAIGKYQPHEKNHYRFGYVPAEYKYIMSLLTGLTGKGSVKELHIGNSSIIPEHFRKQTSAYRKPLLPEIKLYVQYFFLEKHICQGKSCLNILARLEKTTSFWLFTGRYYVKGPV